MSKHGQGDGTHNIFTGGRVEYVALQHYLALPAEGADDGAITEEHLFTDGSNRTTSAKRATLLVFRRAL